MFYNQNFSQRPPWRGHSVLSHCPWGWILLIFCPVLYMLCFKTSILRYPSRSVTRDCLSFVHSIRDTNEVGQQTSKVLRCVPLPWVSRGWSLFQYLSPSDFVILSVSCHGFPVSTSSSFLDVFFSLSKPLDVSQEELKNRCTYIPLMSSDPLFSVVFSLPSN